MTAFVADGGKAHKVFAGFTDGGNARRRNIEFGADRGFAFERAFAAQWFGAVELHFVILNKNVRPCRGSAGDDESVDADALELQREITGGERIGDKSGKRRFGDYGILRSRGEAGAD